MTFEDLRGVGLPLGSGVVMVFDETRDMRDALNRLGHFFAHESCGKCYPCQMGTQRQKEILERVASGKTLPDDVIRLQDVGWTMTDASLCGLGQTAASAVLSAMKLWPELFEVGYKFKEAKVSKVSKAPKAAKARKPVKKIVEKRKVPKAPKVSKVKPKVTKKVKTKVSKKKTVARKNKK